MTIAELENPAQLGGDTLARKWVIDVDVAFDPQVPLAVPTWKRIRGITTQSPQENPTTQDSSTYDSQGWQSTAVTAMGWGWELTVARKTAEDGVTYDPAQEYLRAKSLQMGPSNVARVRAYEWNGVDGPRVQAYSGLVGVSYAEQGGEMSALSTANFVLSGQGRRADIPHPMGPIAWAATTAYTLGEQVVLSGGAVLQAVVVNGTGTSGATAPVAPGTVGSTVVDGTAPNQITWKLIHAA